MTKEDYREHMKTYSRDTAVMSFVVYKHPSYQALKAAGKKIVPWLLEDLIDRDWHCNSCYGFGYKIVTTADEEWETAKTWPPRSAGTVCPECKGKGNICHWACMSLLNEIVVDFALERPTPEYWMRGRLAPLTDMWKKWGEHQGYLPSTPDAKETVF